MKIETNDVKTAKIWLHFAGFFGCFVIGGIVAAIPRMVMKDTAGLVFLSESARIPLTITAFYFYAKYFIKYPLNEIVLDNRHTRIFTWFIIALLFPASTLFLFYITGNLTLATPGIDFRLDSVTGLFIWGFGMSLATGVVEEVFVRGYLYNLFKIKYRSWMAFLIPALFFTALHLGAVGSFLNVVQLFVAGLLVSFLFTMVYLYSKSIWNAGIVHAVWNIFFLGKIISFESSSSKLKEAIISFNVGNNDLINGGKTGIDCSLPAILVYLSAGIILWILYKRMAGRSLPGQPGPAC
ncbi:MAG: CPBP family intramembrane glutamic endopeptidase [Bacteroidota bacterium]